jgi:hypothetical protein
MIVKLLSSLVNDHDGKGWTCPPPHFLPYDDNKGDGDTNYL